MSNEEGEAENEGLWIHMPQDLLGQILSRTSIDNVIRSSSVCKEWESYIRSGAFIKLWKSAWPYQGPPWLFAVSKYNCRDCCCAYNPIANRWYSIPLCFLPPSIRFPVAAIGQQLLIKGSSTGSHHLAVCNPIAKKWRLLPALHRPRLNPCICGIESKFGPTDKYGCDSSFQVIVAGGSSQNGNSYEPTIEIYDSCADSWHVIGEVPCEYAVRLAVWTPNDTVYCNGVIYFLTSARPYSIIAFDLVKGTWSEVMVPRPQQLMCSFLIKRRGRLTLVGGLGSPKKCKCLNIWELQGDGWPEIETMPGEVFNRFFGEKADFDYKCAGSGDCLYFFRDYHTEILVCELFENQRANWRWISCFSFVGSKFPRFSFRGMLIQPGLDVFQ